MRISNTVFIAAISIAFHGHAEAGNVVVAFTSLPSAQGWTYFSDATAEPDVYSLAGGVLSMDATLIPAAYYKMENIIDPLLPFVLSATARVSSGGGQTLGFYVVAEGQFAAINIAPTQITDEATKAVLTSLDNTIFRNIRVEGTFGTGFEVFVDGASIASSVSFSTNNDGNLVLFGDSGGFSSGFAEITAFSFQQPVPLPAALWLLGPALGGLGMLRRRVV